MKGEGNEYKRAVSVLRRSVPDLEKPEMLSANVIERIRRYRGSYGTGLSLEHVLFGWTRIGWVRTSLAAVSVLLVFFFIYQQTMILRGVNYISNRSAITGISSSPDFNPEIARQIKMLKIAGKGFSGIPSSVSEEQIEILLDSYSELMERYSGLLRIIEEDPELKKYVEKKLMEKDKQSPGI